MTLKQRNLARVYLGLKDKSILTDDDLDLFIDLASTEDKSDGDDGCVALLACSKFAQSAKWHEVTRLAEGTTMKTSDTFEKLYWDRMKNLGKVGTSNTGVLVSQADYD
jgi:hypothetical protein